MADESKKELSVRKGVAEQTHLGLSVADFQKMVDAVRAAIDSADLLLFFGGTGLVRAIGQPEKLVAVFSSDPEMKKDVPDPQKALDEILNFIQLILSIPKAKLRISFLEENIYDDEFKKRGRDKGLLRASLAEKIAYLEEQPFMKGFARRLERLSTATEGCLEDVDFELIEERQDQIQDKRVRQPFVRLRIRHAIGNANIAPFFLPFPFTVSMSPWGRRRFPTVELKSFQLECDENDIDLLLRRLLEAKNLLLKRVVLDKDSSGQGRQL